MYLIIIIAKYIVLFILLVLLQPSGDVITFLKLMPALVCLMRYSALSSLDIDVK